MNEIQATKKNLDILEEGLLYMRRWGMCIQSIGMT